ncbi:DHH family phosphoesterase [Cellulosilyticum sp. ST5]|uniref:Cyclic-di-AMP phosphodiesterase n=1 Tax=Cellulosilyticum lentocellum (strain ATCC 49066 / DSM 5427 / NCIMB 11756 / RHM5) TaxID=642492 RepID=F2JRZ1_CELLD|nr:MULTISPECIES: DHH family phosphoesterase [Cellulosilyticum]ADZ82805.1 putative phosphoesterase [Cellulosilyticum lentocellum DSM 5427]QEH68347.1 phosphoesterase [Cellulosilyticum sp. WCF-2]
MKSKRKKNFSYAMVIFRFTQALVTIGLITQLSRVFSTPQAILSLLIYAILLIVSIFSEREVCRYVKLQVEKEVDEITVIKDSMFSNVEIPVVIIEEIGTIKWVNIAFKKICKDKELLGKNIKTILPDLKLGEWVTNKQISDKHFHLEGNTYRILVENFHRGENDQINKQIVYFLDYTENEKLKNQIQEERCMMGYLCIDNIDEISHSIEEVRRPMLLAIIDRKINLWFKEREVVIARIERDKYIMVFNKRELERMKETKFDILDEMRNIQVGNELPVTVSLGIGFNLKSLLSSKEDARIAFDLAQGRGGDQAIIKNNDKYTFYGGKTKEVEKSARVKVRLKAYAFKELLHEADKIYIMGHKGIDMDCLGAAIGVYRAASIMGKKAHIILDGPTFAVKGLYDRIVQSKEYEDLFISHEEAEKEIKRDTLLVIVDTHRRSYLEYPELLDKAEKVVVFDHHRKSTDYIEDAVLTYLEPFISSTCEMIAEILNYLTDKVKLTPIEADALLAGITIDTKNFVFKAGVRTFEAAAFLRRNGADSSRVRLLFQNDMQTYKIRAMAIQNAEIWNDNMAISEVNGQVANASIIAAQVADELLNIKGIVASFVLTMVDNCVLISARALADTNVQRIMELLGGGGHLGIAGAQLKDTTIHEAKIYLKDAINKYFEEGETK